MHDQRSTDTDHSDWIGDTYSSLEQPDTDAIGIRDNALHRGNRAIPYSNNRHCKEAIGDAEAALAMNPYSEPSYHTSTEAHLTLAVCLMDSGEEPAALVHLEQAMSIAQVHGYTEGEIAGISAILDKLKTSMVPGKSIAPIPPITAATQKQELRKPASPL